MSLDEFRQEFGVAYGEGIGENSPFTQDCQLDGVAQGEGLGGKLSQNVPPIVRGALVG